MRYWFSLAILFSFALFATVDTNAAKPKPKPKPKFVMPSDDALLAVPQSQWDQQDDHRKALLYDGAKNDVKKAISERDTVQEKLTAADANFVTLGKQYEKAKSDLAEVTKENNRRGNIIGGAAALIILLLCLWLKVPAMSPPVGIIATCASPVIAATLIRYFHVL